MCDVVVIASDLYVVVVFVRDIDGGVLCVVVVVIIVLYVLLLFC